MSAANLKPALTHPLAYMLVSLILVGGLGGWWFLTHFEKEAYEVYRGISPEASRNPLLAAEHYLERAGIQAESLTGLDLLAELPPAGDAIFIRRIPLGLARNITDSLLSWVEAGGHLLLVPNETPGGRSGKTDLATRIGVRYAENESSDSDCGCPPEEDGDEATTEYEELVDAEPELEPEIEAEEEERVYRPFTRVMRVLVDDREIEIESSPARYLVDINGTASYRISGTYVMEYTEEEDKGRDDNFEVVEVDDAWLLQYDLGYGRVTVLSDIDLFMNEGIDTRDHAFVLSRLVHDASKVWLLYSSNVDPLPVLAWKKMPLFWVSLLATILLFIWMRQVRPGPVRRHGSEQAHNILSHIDAVGRYCWRMDQCSELLRKNRNAFMQQYQKRTRGIRPDSETSRIERSELVGTTGLSTRELSDAFDLSPSSEQDIIKTSRALQKCRQTLLGGNRKRS